MSTTAALKIKSAVGAASSSSASSCGTSSPLRQPQPSPSPSLSQSRYPTRKRNRVDSYNEDEKENEDGEEDEVQDVNEDEDMKEEEGSDDDEEEEHKSAASKSRSKVKSKPAASSSSTAPTSSSSRRHTQQPKKKKQKKSNVDSDEETKDRDEEEKQDEEDDEEDDDGSDDEDDDDDDDDDDEADDEMKDASDGDDVSGEEIESSDSDKAEESRGQSVFKKQQKKKLDKGKKSKKVKVYTEISESDDEEYIDPSSKKKKTASVKSKKPSRGAKKLAKVKKERRESKEFDSFDNSTTLSDAPKAIEAARKLIEAIEMKLVVTKSKKKKKAAEALKSQRGFLWKRREAIVAALESPEFDLNQQSEKSGSTLLQLMVEAMCESKYQLRSIFCRRRMKIEMKWIKPKLTNFALKNHAGQNILHTLAAAVDPSRSSKITQLAFLAKLCLFKWKMNVMEADNEGNIPLHGLFGSALVFGIPVIRRLLTSSQARLIDLSVTDEDGDTPLHLLFDSTPYWRGVYRMYKLVRTIVARPQLLKTVDLCAINCDGVSVIDACKKMMEKQRAGQDYKQYAACADDLVTAWEQVHRPTYIEVTQVHMIPDLSNIVIEYLLGHTKATEELQPELPKPVPEQEGYWTWFNHPGWF